MLQVRLGAADASSIVATAASSRPTDALRVGAALLLAVWAAYVGHLLTGLGGADAGELAQTWGYVVLLGGSGLLCVLRGLAPSPGRRAWVAMGVGLLAWTGGEVYGLAATPPGGTLPSPSPADAGYLALYPAAFLAVGLLLHAQVVAPSRSLCLDGVATALTAAALAATALAAPIVDGALAEEGATRVLNLAYPVADLALLALVIAGFGLTGWRPGRRLLLLGAGLASLALADGTYLYASWAGAYAPNGPIDAGWTTAGVLIALAALARPAPPRRAPTDGVRVIVLPVGAAVLAVGVLLYDHATGVPTVAVALAAAALLAVAVRTAMAFDENQRMLADSREHAVRDPLTGLGNRRRLDARLAAALDADDIPGRVRVLAILDLDGFKGYNDAFGHPAGDALLARLGTALADAVADDGEAFRLGGDEFCVLLDLDAGREDVVLAAAAAALSESGRGFDVAPSVGVARLREEAADAEAALQLADRRMYARKADGRTSPGRQTRDVLVSALRERGSGYRPHVTDVGALARRTAARLDLDAEARDEAGRAAELHDIGRMAIPDAILDRPGPLDEDEWRFVRRHPVVGERILGAAPALRGVARLVRCGQERWDGTGYPDALGGEQIPLGGRIVAVCAAYEAMIAGRPYRAARAPGEAIAELERCAGTQFDPAVVAAFVAVVSTAAEQAVDDADARDRSAA